MKTSHLHCSYQLPRILAIVLLASALPLASLSAQQTYTWDNGASNNLWGTTNNWVGDPALTFNNQTDLIFNTNSVVNLANAVSIGGARTIRSLTFGANFVGSTTATFDIRSYSAIGSGAVNLTFAAASGNASINVAQSTSGAAQIRLGAAAGGTQDQGSIVLSTNLDLAQNNTFFNATGFQFDGKITGAGAINKTGLGEVRLIRDNSGWSGGMNINEGNVTIFNSPSAMGTGTWTLGGGASNTSLRVGSANTYSNAGGIVVAAGAGTRTIANYTNTNAAGNSTLSGAITLNKDAIFDITQVTAGTHDRLSLSGAVGGAGGIVKTGTGILLLTASNSYSGATDIQGGKLYLGGAGRLGSGAVTISSGANLDFGTGASQTNVVANNISGAGSILQSSASTDTRFTGDVTSTGGLTINNGTVRIGNGTTTGSYSGDTTISNGATLAFARSNDYTHVGTISGAGGVSKTAAGTVTMTASNSYSGVTSLFDGALVAGNADALGTGNITFRPESGNDGTLRYTAASAGTDWASRIKNSTGTIRLGTAGNNVNLAGAIDSSNTNGLVKSGAGTLTLGGTNTYLGNTTVSAGTLSLSSSGSLLFIIGGSATNNRLLGSGTTSVDGRFAFDLTAASTDTNATWSIVAGTLTNTYGTNFIVTGFNGSGGLWTNTTNGVNYVFSQSTGVLSVQSTGAPTPYNAWADYWANAVPTFTNTAGTDNPDGDPFDNNEEFAFDGNPTIGTGALLTATKAGTNAVFNYVAQTNTNAVTYQVQVTGNLTTGWTNAGVTISNSTNQTGISQTNIYERREFTVPATGNSFYRVQATVLP
jgi:autotransporter-associated beta strand protein